MNNLLNDVRYGIRVLLKKPGFTLIAVISLALGIGANTAIFSLLNTAILRPLPVAEPEQIVSLNNTQKDRMFPTFSYPNYKDFRDRSGVFSSLISYRFAPVSLSYDGINQRLWGYVVTGNYFEGLGVSAAVGRVISTDDDLMPGAHPVAVISYQFWQSRFGGSPEVIGKSVLVNGRDYTIIGVAAKGFNGTEIVAAPEMWFPMAMQAQIEVGDSWLDEREVENIFIQGRLKPGVSISQAQSAVDSVALELEREYPDINEGKRVVLAVPGLMGSTMRGPVLGFTGLLMGVVGLVLLLACTNLANLLLARANERRREIAVRLAVGASRLRLIRQLLTESVLLAIAGGALGLLLAYWLTDMAAALRPPVDLPFFIDLQIDHRVLIFTTLVSIVTGVVFGLLPALQATKTDLVTALKDESSLSGHKRSWLKGGLIVFQIALSLVLLVGGGLMLRSLQRAETIDLGFDPKNAIEISFNLQLQGYDSGQGREFQKRLLERVRALPGVQHAGIADMVPVDLHFGRQSVFIEGQLPERSASTPRVMSSRISTGYFGAMSTRLIQGRDFTEQDDINAKRVVIINEAMARRLWPGENPIGKRLSLGRVEAPKMEVIGVVQDGKYARLSEAPSPFLFRPLLQSYSGSSNLIVRAESEPQRLIAAVRNELLQLDPHLPLSNAKTMLEHMSLPLLPTRVAAVVFASFGLLALALAAIGLYGVMSYAISRRTREIGVRMALGAQKSDVLRMVLRQGIVLTLIGIASGLAASLMLTRLMETLLFGVTATDPATFVIVAMLLAIVALVACFVPARRAANVDPMEALRYE